MPEMKEHTEILQYSPSEPDQLYTKCLCKCIVFELNRSKLIHACIAYSSCDSWKKKNPIKPADKHLIMNLVLTDATLNCKRGGEKNNRFHRPRRCFQPSQLRRTVHLIRPGHQTGSSKAVTPKWPAGHTTEPAKVTRKHPKP